MERILTPVGWNLLFAALLAIGTWLVGTLPLLRRRPTFLYMLWLLVLLKLIVPPLVPVPVLAPIPVAKVEMIYSPPELVTLMSPIRFDPPPLAPEVPPPEFHLVDLLREPRFWMAALLVVSLSVTVVLWLLALRQQLRWHRLLNQKSQPTPERLEALARTAAEKLCCKTIPEIRLVDAGLTPFLWTGSGKLSVVLSPTLVEELSDEQLLCVLMHELAHFQRRDHWGHLFAGWVTSLFWWNPVCWWAWRELRALQEICCDALVLRYSSDSRRLYAETLYAVLESLQTRKSVQPTLSCSFGDSQHLRRRFTMLADTKLKPRLTPLTRLALLTLATLLPCLPTRAEPPEPEVEQAESVAAEENDSKSGWITISVKLYKQLNPESEPEELIVPRIKVLSGNTAVISTEVEPSTENAGIDGKPVVGKILTFMAIPTLTDDGKVSMKIEYQLGKKGHFQASMTPSESPLFMEINETRKVVLTGTADKPTLWADVTVTRDWSQPVRIRGKLNDRETESQGPVTEFDTTVTLNDRKPTYVAGMLTRQSGKVDPEAKEKSVWIFAIQNGEKIAVTTVIQADLPEENFKSTSLVDYGKSYTTIFRQDDQNEPLVWLELEVTPVSGAVPVATAEPVAAAEPVIAAVLPVPTPAMELRIKTHPLPERFWLKPGGNWVSPKREEFQPILDHITQKISPESWSEKGGPARYELLLLDHSLVVLASPEMHEEIASHLKKVWHAPAGKKEKHSLSIGISLTGPSLFGSPSLPPSKTTVMAYGIVEQSGKDQFGRPVSTREDYEKLVTALCEIEPKSWEKNGGQGKIEYSILTGKIVFQNNSDVSGQVMEYCSGLMKQFIAAERSQGRPAPPALQPIKPASLEVPQSKPLTPLKPASGKNQSSTGFPNPFYRVSYNVDQLLELSPGRDLTKTPINEHDLNTLANKLYFEVVPKSWKVCGGAGTIQLSLNDPRGACLLVNQTDNVHEQISLYLDQLRAKKGIDTSKNFSRARTRVEGVDRDKIQTMKFNAAGTLVCSITKTDGNVYADPVQLEELLASIQQIEPLAWKMNAGPCSVAVTPDQCGITVTATGQVMEQVIKFTRLLHAERDPGVTYYEGPVAPMTEEERRKAYSVNPDRADDKTSGLEMPIDEDLPSLAEILKSLPAFEASPDSETVRLNPRVQIEMVRNETIPARFYPLVGPAKILKKEYKCTVVSEHRTTTKSDQPVSFGTKQAEVVYLDRNRMIRGE